MRESLRSFSGHYGASIPYFPKLVAAIPFTPAASHRLLVHPAESRAKVVPALTAGLRQVADEVGASSVHVLFCRPEEVDELVPAGFLPRSSFQFHWTNRQPLPYRDFDDFLAGYRSRQRKQVRHERRVASEHGLRVVVAPGTELDDRAWAALDRCYRATVHAYGNIDFLTSDFFVRVRRRRWGTKTQAGIPAAAHVQCPLDPSSWPRTGRRRVLGPRSPRRGRGHAPLS
jgi:predicted N-acyltransferase